MEENLKQQLEQFALKMIAAMESGADFAAREIPLLVQEWLQWQVISNSILGVTTIFIAALVYRSCAVWLPNFTKAEQSSKSYYSPKEVETNYIANRMAGKMLGSLFAIMIGLVFGGTFLVAAAKAILAPRVVILEWLRGMI